LAAIATLIITIGGVAAAINATLDLVNRLAGEGLGAVYLGVEVQDVVVQRARNLRSSTVTPYVGVRVTAVDRNSPASRAGVKRGDIITTINGARMLDVDAFEEVMKNAKPGDYLRLSIVRGWPVGLPDTHRVSIRVKLEPR